MFFQLFSKYSFFMVLNIILNSTNSIGKVNFNRIKTKKKLNYFLTFSSKILRIK